MKHTQTKLVKQRLRSLRKLMREKAVTQAEIAKELDIYQSKASDLIAILIEMGHARFSHKIAKADGKIGMNVYVLTDSYLATVKPNGPEEYDPPVMAIRGKPSLWQRFRCWVAGNPYAGVSA